MDIGKFYDGKSVIITGTTGFIGKILLEKILYSCDGVKNVYILVREKNPRNKKEENENRVDQLINSEVFDRIRKEKPDVLKKVIPIWSDLAEPGLGISETDREILVKNASIIFHSAATTLFLNPFKDSIKNNLIATKILFELFKDLDEKLAFVYISTAFCNTHLEKIEEKVYKTISPEYMIECYKQLDEDTMDSLFPTVSEGRAYTYFLTKAMAETYLDEQSKSFPIAIIRPALVGQSAAEPIPGWGDAKSMFTSVAHIMALGLVHNVPLSGEMILNMVPADIVCNLSIAVAASLQQATNLFETNTVPVYNCVSHRDNELTLDSAYKFGQDYVDMYPSTVVVCYPHLSFTNNFIKLKFGEVFHHYLPAFCLDMVRRVNGKPPKFLQMYRKYFLFFNKHKQLLFKEFTNKNSDILYEQMSKEDQKTFNFDLKSISWTEYFINWFNGTRKLYYPNEKYNFSRGQRHMRLLFLRYILYSLFLAVGLTAPITLPLYNALS